MVKVKDRRYITVRKLILSGYINSFIEIFDTLPKSILARDLRMNNNRFTRLMNNVQQFTLKEVFTISEILEVEETKMLQLIFNDHEQYKKEQSKRRINLLPDQ